MSDNILVRMPRNLYQFLQATTITQDYMLQVAVGAERKNRDENYQFHIRMLDKFKYLAPCLQVLVNVVPVIDYSEWDVEQRREYDCFLRFDDEMFARARRIADTVGFTELQGLNTLVGAGAGMHPVLNALQLPPPTEDVLILKWSTHDNEGRDLYDFIANNHIDDTLEVVYDDRDMTKFEDEVEAYIKYISMFKCVIGPKSPATYLAAALKRAVIEIFPDKKQGMLYGSVGQDGYWAVLSPNASASYIWSVWENRTWPYLQGVLSNTSNPVESVTTVSEASIAENVSEK